MTGGVSVQQLEWSLGINLVANWLEIGPESLRYLLDVITESQFTDDTALYATTEEDFVTVTQFLWMLLVVGVLQLV